MSEITRHCPECGEEATEESIVRERLRDVGYLHTDVYMECSNGHEWKHGVPDGESESDDWVCPSCEGDMVPHFGNIVLQEKRMSVRPKCMTCYYVPDDPIDLSVDMTSDTQGRVFFGHHRTTGDTNNASEQPHGA